MSNDKGKVITLTEVSNKVVERGLESLLKEDIEKEMKEEK